MDKHVCSRVFSTIQQRFVITYSSMLTVMELKLFLSSQVVLKVINITAIDEDMNLCKRVCTYFLTLTCVVVDPVF